MRDIVHIGSFALIILTLAITLSFTYINTNLAKNNINKNDIQTIDTNNDIKILNNQMVKTEHDNWIVSGQAQNTGNYKIRYASIEVYFYDKKGNLKYSHFDSKSFIAPNEIWNFEVVYPGSTIPHSYKVELGYSMVH